jgi:hypothetical protein
VIPSRPRTSRKCHFADTKTPAYAIPHGNIPHPWFNPRSRKIPRNRSTSTSGAGAIDSTACRAADSLASFSNIEQAPGLTSVGAELKPPARATILWKLGRHERVRIY